MSGTGAALRVGVVSLVIGTTISASHAAAIAPNRKRARDIAAIDACLKTLPSIGRCVVLCDLQRVDGVAPDNMGGAFTCRQSVYNESINTALLEKWPQACVNTPGVLISPVVWHGSRSAVIQVGIPADPSGPDTCIMTRTIVGRWKVRLGIRE
jgi:hypothetical protein